MIGATKGAVSLDDLAQWKPRAVGGASTRPQSAHIVGPSYLYKADCITEEFIDEDD